MIGDGRDVRIGVRVEVYSALTVIARSLNDVEQMRNDAARQEAIASVVEIHAPGIARPMREDLETILERMITPDARVDRDALLLRRPRFADERMGEHAM